MKNFRYTLLFFIVFCFIYFAKKSEACSVNDVRYANIQSRIVEPEDKSTNVPLNANIIVEYIIKNAIYSERKALLDLKLQANNKIVETTITKKQSIENELIIEIKPSQKLASNQKYEILSKVHHLPCGNKREDDCYNSEYKVISSFTTGTNTDVLPASFSGVKSIVGSTKSLPSKQCNKGDPCCEPGHTRFSFQVDWNSVKEKYIRYNVYNMNNGKLIMERVRKPNTKGGMIGYSICDGVLKNYSPSFYRLANINPDPTDNKISLMIRSIDLSGNEDQNKKIASILVSCSSKKGVSCSMYNSKIPHSSSIFMIIIALVLSVLVPFRK